MSSHDAQILVIGAGIAGASVAAHICLNGTKPSLSKMEECRLSHDLCGSHEPDLWPRAIRALTRAGRSFYHTPPGLPGRRPHPAAPVALSDARRAGSSSRKTRDPHTASRRSALPKALHPLLRETYPKACYLDMLHLRHRRRSRCIRVICAYSEHAAEGSSAMLEPLPSGTIRACRTVSIPPVPPSSSMRRALGADQVELRRTACRPRSQAAQHCGRGAAGGIQCHGVAAHHRAPAKPGIAGHRVGNCLLPRTPVDPHDAYAEDETLAIGIERFQMLFISKSPYVERKLGGLAHIRCHMVNRYGYDPQSPTASSGWPAEGGYHPDSAPGLSTMPP